MVLINPALRPKPFVNIDDGGRMSVVASRLLHRLRGRTRHVPANPGRLRDSHVRTRLNVGCPRRTGEHGSWPLIRRVMHGEYEPAQVVPLGGRQESTYSE